jgi:hypothetical protein
LSSARFAGTFFLLVIKVVVRFFEEQKVSRDFALIREEFGAHAGRFVCTDVVLI